MGWLTNEELWWDDRGGLRTHAPSTYKIPAINEPTTVVMNVALMDNPSFHSATPYFSKAVGEPPLMLAISVHQALIEAVASQVSRPKLDALNSTGTRSVGSFARRYPARKAGLREGTRLHAIPSRDGLIHAKTALTDGDD